MTREETLQVLSILKAAYPHSYKNMTKLDAEAVVTLWHRQFAGEDAQAVGMALDALIALRKEGYSPTIGEVKEQLHRVRTENSRLDDGEAWALVEKACRNGLYGYREEFEKLPPDVQRAIGAPEQLKAWAAMDEETVNSVVASNFRKTYRTVQQREKESSMLDGLTSFASIRSPRELGELSCSAARPLSTETRCAGLSAEERKNGVRAFAAELAQQMSFDRTDVKGLPGKTDYHDGLTSSASVRFPEASGKLSRSAARPLSTETRSAGLSVEEREKSDAMQ